ncbi:hypothetical protein TWF481_010978 [Arthrobotrys musiformis]|uniref:Uncharacterized protein n=1 Tax=Arthrobotrys musiformis TaxID=47236 RepID=A0AAV9VY20_9PEZI
MPTVITLLCSDSRKASQKSEILPGFTARSTVLRTCEILETILKNAAPRELEKLKGVNFAFYSVITRSKALRYIMFRESSIPCSLRYDQDFLRSRVPPGKAEVQLNPWVDILLRKLWVYTLAYGLDNLNQTKDPLEDRYLQIPNDIFVTRPPTKIMSFMINNLGNLQHLVVTSQGDGVSLREFMQALGHPIIKRCNELVVAGQRPKFPLPDVCVSVRFKYPVSGVRNFGNQQEVNNVDVRQYRQDYGTISVATDGNKHWFWDGGDQAAALTAGEVRRAAWSQALHERRREDITVIWDTVFKLSFWRRDPTGKKSMVGAQNGGPVHLTGGWGITWGH